MATPKILVPYPKKGTTKVRNSEDHPITSECSEGHIIVFTWAKLIQSYKFEKGENIVGQKMLMTMQSPGDCKKA